MNSYEKLCDKIGIDMIHDCSECKSYKIKKGYICNVDWQPNCEQAEQAEHSYPAINSDKILKLIKLISCLDSCNYLSFKNAITRYYCMFDGFFGIKYTGEGENFSYAVCDLSIKLLDDNAIMVSDVKCIMEKNNGL